MGIGGNTVSEREVEIDLSFLKDGNYEADIYFDGEDYLTLDNRKETINSSSKLTVKMNKNGGFAIRIIKK